MKTWFWWGEGRIDTIDKYTDDSLTLIARCRMPNDFFRSGNGPTMHCWKMMDKGGTQTGDQIRKFAARMAKFDIIPDILSCSERPLTRRTSDETD